MFVQLVSPWGEESDKVEAHSSNEEDEYKRGTPLVPGFLPGFFSGGIYCYANFFCYAKFSIVFGPNLMG